MTEISEKEVYEVWGLLKEVKKNSGYFPTSKKIEDGDPRPDILYSSSPGWNSLITRLPTPLSGYHKIIEAHIFKERPISLYM